MDSSYTVTPNFESLVDLPLFVSDTAPSAPLNNDQVSVTAQLIVDCRCHLGECILYDDRTNEIVFISILDRAFYKLPLSNTATDDSERPIKLQVFPNLPKMIGSIALLEDPSYEPGTYLVAWEDGFQLYNLEQNKPLGPMSMGESVNPSGRLNDGRTDPTGKRFVCGGCTGNTTSPLLKVYKCEYNSETKQLYHEPVVNSIQVTNSICWSVDGNTMYLANSPDLSIHQYDYDTTTGHLSNKRLFHKKIVGVPDGSCVDAQGYVWNATWRQGAGTGMVHRIDPTTGQVVFTVYLPDNTSEASCCCFGGPNLDILFITTAREHLDPSTELNAGGLYAVKLPKGMTGLAEKRFITL